MNIDFILIGKEKNNRDVKSYYEKFIKVKSRFLCFTKKPTVEEFNSLGLNGKIVIISSDYLFLEEDVFQKIFLEMRKYKVWIGCNIVENKVLSDLVFINAELENGITFRLPQVESSGLLEDGLFQAVVQYAAGSFYSINERVSEEVDWKKEFSVIDVSNDTFKLKAREYLVNKSHENAVKNYELLKKIAPAEYIEAFDTIKNCHSFAIPDASIKFFAVDFWLLYKGEEQDQKECLVMPNFYVNFLINYGDKEDEFKKYLDNLLPNHVTVDRELFPTLSKNKNAIYDVVLCFDNGSSKYFYSDFSRQCNKFLIVKDGEWKDCEANDFKEIKRSNNIVIYGRNRK